MTILSAKNLTKIFYDDQGKENLAIENVSLSVEGGEIFMFLGPSGCGKSTLLRILAGLEKQSSGEVSFNDFTARDTSFVFQQFALLPWLTVLQNIALGLVGRGVAERERNIIVEHELSVFGLTEFANSFPRDLSGGMKQRVGLARAFATNPKVIFMDEPFSELDSFTAVELRQELLSIWKERRPTVVIVTHNISEAIELADTIAVMTPRPGRIEEIIQNKLKRPRVLRSKGFFDLEDGLYKLVKP